MNIMNIQETPEESEISLQGDVISETEKYRNNSIIWSYCDVIDKTNNTVINKEDIFQTTENGNKKLRFKEGFCNKAKTNDIALKCTLCDAEYRFNGQSMSCSRMTNHLIKCNEQKRKISSLQKQPRKTLLNKPKAFDKTFLYLLAKYVVTSRIAYQLIENENFIKVVNYQRFEELYVPKRKKMTAVLTEMNSKTRLYILKELNEVYGICCTLDGWTAKYKGTHYISFTAHYIKDKKMKNRVLELCEFSEKETSENVSLFIKEKIKTWELTKFENFLIITDNAPNVLNGVRLSGMTCFGCSCHKFALVMKDVMQQSNYYSRLYEKFKSIAHNYIYIREYREVLKELEDVFELEWLHPLQEVPTRWFTNYVVVERILSITNKLNSASLSVNRNDLYITQYEKFMANFFVEVVKYVKIVEERLSSEEIGTLSLVIPAIKGLIQQENTILMNIDEYIESKYPCEIIGDEQLQTIEHQGELPMPEASAILKNFVESLISSLNTRFFGENSILQNPACVLSTLLHPCYKKFVLDQSMRDFSVTLLQHELDKVYTSPNVSTEDTDMLNLMISAAGCNLNTSSDEIQNYISMPEVRCNTVDTIFNFWEERRKYLPNLYVIAMKYLCNLASSTCSERLFSSASNFFTSKRTNLTPQHLSELCSLKSFFDNGDDIDQLL